MFDGCRVLVTIYSAQLRDNLELNSSNVASMDQVVSGIPRGSSCLTGRLNLIRIKVFLQRRGIGLAEQRYRGGTLTVGLVFVIVA